MTCTEERFLAAVSKHEMKVLVDEGVYRHIRFQDPEMLNCWFEIVTWPNCLCINGDMGNYLFSRLPDIFMFFRRDGSDEHAKSLFINREYWAEKLRAQDCHGKHCDGVKRWSSRKFDTAIKNHFDDYVELHLSGVGDQTKRGELWRDIEEDVLIHNEDRRDAMEAAESFNEHGLRFSDFWEVDCTEWSFHFVWCLYAIVWGIQQYDSREELKNVR